MLLFILNKDFALLSIRDFNTSHVTVYPNHLFCPPSVCVISIHLMLLFIASHKSMLIAPFSISIHLMLLFIRWRVCMGKICIISIHLMLLFIQSLFLYLSTRLYISIHLMLLFISTRNTEYFYAFLFQYISCYCLSRS